MLCIQCELLRREQCPAVIGVAVIIAVILAVCLRSWQLRRRRRLGYDVQSTWEFRLQQRCRRLLGVQVAHNSSPHFTKVYACLTSRTLDRLAELCKFQMVVALAIGNVPAYLHH